MNELRLKLLVWAGLLLLGSLLALLGLRGLGELFRVAQQANTVEQALNLIEPRRAAPGRLEWLPDDPTPRPLEPFRRDEITSDYLLAHEELSHAHFTGETIGLRSYFQSGALEDALLMGQGPRGTMVDWKHRLRLHFYAPDGATVAFSDTYWYVLASGQFSTRLAERTLEVVMQLDDGNWRIHHWRLLAERPLSVRLLPVTTAGVRGVNYQPRSHPFDLFGPGYEPREVISDMRISRMLGLSTLRVFVPYPPSPGYRQRLEDFLNLAQAQQMKVIVTLLDSYTHYRFEDFPNVFAHLEELAPLLRHPAVWLIDIKNEPDRDYARAGERLVVEFLRAWSRAVRYYSSKPITVGFIEPHPDLVPEIEVLSFHHYGTPAELLRRIEGLAKYQKPLLLEEFGFHTQRNKLPDPHTELEQAHYYERVLQIARRHNLGWLAWTLYDFDRGTMPGGRAVEKHLGLLRADSTPKPVVQVLAGQPAPPLGWAERLGKWLVFWPGLLLGGAMLGLGIWLARRVRFIRKAL